MSEAPTEPTTTYEQAREELADVVRRLEAGGLTLEESLTLWERGEQLAELCQHWLDRAREGPAAPPPTQERPPRQKGPFLPEGVRARRGPASRPAPSAPRPRRSR